MSGVFNRSLGIPSLPDPVRIELNKLNRAHARETNQAVCDEIEAKIKAIEAEYYGKAAKSPPRAKKPSPDKFVPEEQAKPAAKKPAPKSAPKPAAKPAAKKPATPAKRPRKP